EVVKLHIVYELEAGIAHGAIGKFRFFGFAFFPSADVRKEIAVEPIRLRVFQQWYETASVQVDLLRRLGTADLSQSRENVHMRREGVAVFSALEPRGPTPERRHAGAAVV